ncbi:MAG: SUMF1/EgtB/PvdO family nonheme iron enzyme [Myxococcales bacterium]|nr:SUMF1/EgtB/PvdO family nonheme iron enzyme [Myxococcales bacterium]
MHRFGRTALVVASSVGLMAATFALPSARGALVEPPSEPPSADAEEPEHDPASGPAKPKAHGVVRIKVPEKDGMVRVPGGRFVMGTAFGKAPPNEKPQRTTTSGPFWIDKTEVSVAAYRACVASKHCERPRVTSAQCTYDAQDGELPVSCVRWEDAEAYCRSVGKRLPSEVEWELSARGPSGYVYPWGNRLPDCKLANTLIRDNSGRGCFARPWRVRSVPANASVYGVLDLSGNVEEWTQDWYSEHLGDLAPRSGASHTLRGGGFQTSPSRARASTRDWGSVIEAGPNVGFRCAKDATP